MPAQIRFLSGPERDRVFLLEGTGPVQIGRSSQATIQINDLTISRIHCEIVAQGDQFLLIDANSRGGTFVNGERINQRVLQPDDTIRIAGTTFRLELGLGGEQSTLMADPARCSGSSDEQGLVTPRDPARPTVKKVKPPPAPRPPQLSAERLSELTGYQLGNYWLGEPIATARTGLIFLAQDLKYNRPAALKVLWPEFVREPAEVKRLIRSMWTMMPLNHPHLVKVYAAGRTGPYCWIAMEYVDGESGRRVVEKTVTDGQPDWTTALRVGVHICRGLVFAHYHRIIHRNITPANILLAKPDGRAKLGDLMLAKALEGSLAEQITAAGQVVGDMSYLSPEQISASIGEVDERADIYSLGATLYAMLTGRPPVLSKSILETIRKIWEELPPPPTALQPIIPLEFGQLVMKMLAKNPAHRYQKAAELLGELNRLAGTLRVQT